eukprot:c26592_g1_i1.p1 GENE.c26592_g1_i1~~c26592_g1_i1.p1  ORF type:complete len:396 (-),score=88.10 c26592_g1_i1:17-1150(-)
MALAEPKGRLLAVKCPHAPALPDSLAAWPPCSTLVYQTLQWALARIDPAQGVRPGRTEERGIVDDLTRTVRAMGIAPLELSAEALVQGRLGDGVTADALAVFWDEVLCLVEAATALHSDSDDGGGGPSAESIAASVAGAGAADAMAEFTARRTATAEIQESFARSRRLLDTVAARQGELFDPRLTLFPGEVWQAAVALAATQAPVRHSTAEEAMEQLGAELADLVSGTESLSEALAEAEADGSGLGADALAAKAAALGAALDGVTVAAVRYIELHEATLAPWLSGPDAEISDLGEAAAALEATAGPVLGLLADVRAVRAAHYDLEQSVATIAATMLGDRLLSPDLLRSLNATLATLQRSHKRLQAKAAAPQQAVAQP